MNEVLWIPIVAIAGSFCMIVAVVYFGTRSKQRRAELRADVQMKLIDKFGNADEFVRFLESEKGQQFLEQPRRQTREKVIGSITGALVCTFVGLAFCGCAIVFRDPGFLVPGFIVTGVGLALFIGMAISWRMIKQTNPPTVP